MLTYDAELRESQRVTAERRRLIEKDELSALSEKLDPTAFEVKVLALDVLRRQQYQQYVWCAGHIASLKKDQAVESLTCSQEKAKKIAELSMVENPAVLDNTQCATLEAWVSYIVRFLEGRDYDQLPQSVDAAKDFVSKNGTPRGGIVVRRIANALRLGGVVGGAASCHATSNTTPRHHTSP